MKHVVKGVEPEDFRAWKKRASVDWKPDYASLQNPEKRSLHKSLLQEQGWVCCYCGNRVSLDDSHIEHFHPQKCYPESALEYGNLHASCTSNPGTPLHCGHAKGHRFDTSFISPLEPNCELRFIYGGIGGEIFSSNKTDAAATNMIDVLKLNIPILKNKRKALLNTILSPDFLGNATNEELTILWMHYRKTDVEGKLQSFAHVVTRFIEQNFPFVINVQI
ncbi:MAG: TIGR02646 family protein [Zoogloeaceae bacterium]|jgi:uncharacterized protein (TIGR02646 family)|nr:TIGR02646 family protein [Zoogloeaceae bacterium]